MKKNLVFASMLLVIPMMMFSQTPEQVKIIQKKSNLNGLHTLANTLKQQEAEKQQRVLAYAEGHNIAIDSSYNGIGYHLVDIVDNQPIYIQTYNVDSAAATRTTALNPGGSLNLDLEGENMTVGVWDQQAVLTTHYEFLSNGTSRVTIMDSQSSSGGHATHVGGTIGAAGVNQPDAKGMAPKCFITSYNWNNDQSEATTAASNGLLISNHSYGLAGWSDTGTLQVSAWNFGCYNTDARDWDEIHFDAPYYLMVAAAGNDGLRTNPSPSSGNGSRYDKLGGEKNSKNNLVVANAQVITNSLGNITSLNIAPSSSQGPTDDYRIKPDITGDGVSVYSTYNTNAFSYATETGTSMASPNIAGTLILLQEYYYDLHSEYMRAATLKGLACHTATDATLINDQGVEYFFGPDPVYGWGLLDAKTAAETITADNNNQALIKELVLNDGDTFTFTVTTDDPSSLSATLSWTDPAGTSQSGQLNSLTPALVNDLDLRITDATTTYYPYTLVQGAAVLGALQDDNYVDNIERVDVTSTASGTTTFTITVSHKDNLVNPSDFTNPIQAYSLIVTGSNLTNSLATNRQEFANTNVWPNPANDVVNISFDQDYEGLNYKIYDMQGKLVYNETNQNPEASHTINISSLTQGVYFLQMENDKYTTTKKIIKK